VTSSCSLDGEPTRSAGGDRGRDPRPLRRATDRQRHDPTGSPSRPGTVSTGVADLEYPAAIEDTRTLATQLLERVPDSRVCRRPTRRRRRCREARLACAGGLRRRAPTTTSTQLRRVTAVTAVRTGQVTVEARTDPAPREFLRCASGTLAWRGALATSRMRSADPHRSAMRVCAACGMPRPMTTS